MPVHSPVTHVKCFHHLITGLSGTLILLVLLFVVISMTGERQTYAQGMQGSMTFEQTCLSDIDNPSSQNISVDERDRVHISRLDPSTRGLIYTRLEPGSEPLQEVVAAPIDLELDPVTDTDILARRDQVYICAHRATQNSRSLVVFIRDQEGVWREETLEEEATDGGDCELAWLDGTLNVATERAGGVYWYTRGVLSWESQAISPLGQSQGFDLRLTLTSNGEVLITHRSFNYQSLFITQRVNGAWLTDAVPSFEPLDIPAAGVRPQAIKWANGSIWIFHGSRNGESRLDYEGDGYALVTEDPLTASYTYKWSATEGLGGINAARILTGPNGEEEGYFLTRELLRNPVTGNRYALRLHRFVVDFSTFAFTLNEYYPLAQSIPGQPNFHLEPAIEVDSAGLPVLGHIDRGNTETRSCIWRLADSDGDGLADEGETRRGTNINVSDTDGDGRSDGLEIQQGTDPLVIDEPNPLSFEPELVPFSDEMSGGEEAMAGEAMAGEAMAGEAMAGEAMAGEAMAGEAMAGEAMAGEAMAGEAMAGEAMAGEAMAGEAMAGEAMAGEAMAGEAMAGEAMAGEAMAGEAMAGEAMAGEAMAGEAMAGEAMAGEAMAGEAMAGEAMAGEAMAGEAMAGEAMAGEAMAGEAMAGEAMAGETMAGEAMAGETMAGETMAGETMAGEEETSQGECSRRLPTITTLHTDHFSLCFLDDVDHTWLEYFKFT